jgi:hypothetical protein
LRRRGPGGLLATEQRRGAGAGGLARSGGRREDARALRARMQGARYRARNGVARARSVAFGVPAAAFFERYVLPWTIARGGGVQLVFVSI